MCLCSVIDVNLKLTDVLFKTEIVEAAFSFRGLASEDDSILLFHLTVLVPDLITPTFMQKTVEDP